MGLGNAVTYPVTWGDLYGTFTGYVPLLDGGAGVATTTSATLGTATFNRATTAAARLSTGVWNLGVGAGSPRAHYLASGAYGGYLSEGAATQILLNPRDMTQAAWVATTMTTAHTSTGMDGVASAATRLTATNTNATLLQTVAAVATSRTYSCYIKRITGSGGIGICQDGVTFTDVTAQVNSSGFSLVQLNASQLNAVMGIRLAVSGDAIDVDCNQFEAGAFATTPIPAGGSRSADDLSYAAAGNFNTNVGTLYAEVSSEWATAPALAPIIVGVDAAATQLLSCEAAAAATTVASYDGTNTVQQTGLTSYNGAVQKVAVAWGAGALAVTGNGLAAATGSFDGAYGTTAIEIGAATGATNPWNGTIRNLRIWQSQLSNATLLSITR